jgi:hypothetical protein
MAKSKKKPTAQNIAFIERIEIQIKDKKRQQMLRRAPKPAGANTGDILNQQYLLQRTLAQRIQPQSQQQSQTVNVYLGDIAKLQQQETLKRIDEDASAAIIRQQRGGINQERLDFVLSSLLEQKREVKQQPPPQSFDYGFVEGAPDTRVETAAKSIAALERLNKAGGPRSVAFETTPLLPAVPSSSEGSRRRALTPTERRALSVEAGLQASALSKMTAREFVQKNPDLASEIIRQGQNAIKLKYQKRRAELQRDVNEGKLKPDDADSLLRDFSLGIGYDIKPRIKTAASELATSSLSETQQSDIPKTAAIIKKSQTTSSQISSALSANLRVETIAESLPAAEGQIAEIDKGKAAGLKARGGSVRQKAAMLKDPKQPSILSALSKGQSAALDLEQVEAGMVSPVPTPPGSRPTTGESFTKPPMKQSGAGSLPRLEQ